MTKLEALTELAAKVEAGDDDVAPGDAKYPMFNAFMDVAERGLGMYGPVGLPRLSWDAYHGSLDAAKALHGAVLPGYTWWRDGWGLMYVGGGAGVDGATNPARAWLLAIIRSLIAQERAQALQSLADEDRDLL